MKACDICIDVKEKKHVTVKHVQIKINARDIEVFILQ